MVTLPRFLSRLKSQVSSRHFYEDFLAKVRSREIKFENGTAVRAVLRTTQRKNIRTITDRTIVEVKEVISPSQNLF